MESEAGWCSREGSSVRENQAKKSMPFTKDDRKVLVTTIDVARGGGAKGAVAPQIFKVCILKWSLWLKNIKSLLNFNIIKHFAPQYLFWLRYW